MSVPPPGHPVPPLLPELPTGMKPTGRFPNAAGWSPLVALFGGLGIFLGAAILSQFAALIGVFFGDQADDLSPGTIIGILFVQDLAIIAGVWLVVRVSATVSPLDALGIRWTPFWRALGWTAAIFAVYIALAGIWSQIVDSGEQDIFDDIRAGSLAAKIGLCIGICVMAPLAEEILFRGFMFGGMRRFWGFWPAALVSGLLFGLAHGLGSPIEALPQLALLGFGFALLYELTKSILPGIYLHAFNNSIAFSYGLDLGWETGLVIVGSLSVVTLALFASRRMA